MGMRVFYEFWVKNDEISKDGAFFAPFDILFSELCSLLAVIGIYEKCLQQACPLSSGSTYWSWPSARPGNSAQHSHRKGTNLF